MNNKTDLEKATDIVYGIQWTEDKTLVARIAEALAAERASLPESVKETIWRFCDLNDDMSEFENFKAWQSGEVTND